MAPEAETRAPLTAGATSPVRDPPPTRYVCGGGVHLAFQTYGAGRIDVLVLPGFVSHVERVWEEPRCRAFLSALAEMGRLILLDRRGIGLSDRVGITPTVDATSRDIGTVLDAISSRRVVLFGASEGGGGMHQIRRRSSRSCRRTHSVRLAGEGKRDARLSACVTGQSV